MGRFNFGTSEFAAAIAASSRFGKNQTLATRHRCGLSCQPKGIIWTFLYVFNPILREQEKEAGHARSPNLGALRAVKDSLKNC